MLGENVSIHPSCVPVSLPLFRSRIKASLQKFEHLRTLFHTISPMFEHGNDIWPDQCKYLLSVLNEMNDILQEFYQQIDTPWKFPEELVSQRLLLVMKLQHVTDQIKKLFTLLRRFRMQCHTSTRQTGLLQEQIQDTFALLIQDYNEVLFHLEWLTQQTFFQSHNQHSTQR